MARGKKEETEVNATTREEIWVPTGSDTLDIIVGAGRGYGAEFGQILNIPADSGGGKTAIINEIIANAYYRYKDRLKWEYDATTEGGNDFDTQALYGIDVVNPDPAKQKRSRTVEELFASIMTFMDSLTGNQVGIYAADSLDAVGSNELDKMAEGHIDAYKKGKEFDKGSYEQAKAKFLSSTFFRKISDKAMEKNCLVIIVSQLRDNVGAGLYAPKDRINNGRASIFYGDTRLWLQVKHKIEKNGKPIGAVIRAWTTKSRGPRPYRECFYIFYYTYGIDNIGSNIDYLYDLRTEERLELKKNEAKCIVWDGEEYTREELIKHIEDNSLEAELTDRVRTKWDTEESEAIKEISSRKKRF